MDNNIKTDTSDVETSARPDGKPSRRPGIPLFETLGLEVLESEVDRSRLRYIGKPAYFNGQGVIQGGIITAVMDAAMAVAVIPGLQENERFTSADMTVNFLRAVGEGEYFVEGRIIKRGQRAIFGEATLYNQKGQICATASSTMICWREGK